jgi:polyferredoxin
MRTFVWLRRGWQAVFLGLFGFLVTVTSASLIGGYPVEWFLGLDPLAALATALSARSITSALAWAVPLTILTLVLGRFFCGWICPLGVLHHAIGALGAPRTARERAARNQPRRGYAAKYVILAALLAAAAAGSNQVGLLDPIAFTWRALSTSLVPAADAGAGGVYQGARHFRGSSVIAALFLAALGLNLFVPRLYCRLLCPLGALLGLLARRAPFRLARDEETCTRCGACAADCQGAAEPDGALRTPECMLCLSCAERCPTGAISFGLARRSGAREEVELGRRRAAVAALAGILAVPLARAGDDLEGRPDPRRIRPPGALAEEGFLERCLKCGACMKACPTGGLQPALTEAGLEGLWTPVLVPRHGHCEQACTLCGQVCPTGAIRLLALPEKVGSPPAVEPVRVGSAFVDRGRCLPWAFDTPCIVCEEVCPTAPKAVFFKAEEVVTRDGHRRALQRPYVDLARCWGCGVCEARCPVTDAAAIRVTSVGETRSVRNRVLLGSGGRV